MDWEDDEDAPATSPATRRKLEIAFATVFLGGVGLAAAWGFGLFPASEEPPRGGIRTERGDLITRAAGAPERSRDVLGPGSPAEDVRVSGFTESEPEPEGSPGREVPRRETPVSELELAELLIASHQRVFRRRATLARIGVAWAHLGLEHLKGEAIECNNFGNLSVPEGTRHAHYKRRLSERTRKNAKAALGEWRMVEMRFRAFETREQGVDAYWRLLDQRYKGALAMFDVGNAHHAGRKLGDAGYATAYAQPYALAMGELFGEFRERILPALRAKDPTYEALALEEAGIPPSTGP